MDYKFKMADFKEIIQNLNEAYNIYAPVKKVDKGIYSDTDLITYDKITSPEEIELTQKTKFSPKEIVFPIDQTLFYFLEDKVIEPKTLEKEIIIFARACDINSFRSLDAMFLENGAVKDNYYEKLRKKIKFILLPCDGFENCYCVSLGTNTTEDFSAYVDIQDDIVYCRIKEEGWENFWGSYGEKVEVEPRFVYQNKKELNIPEEIDNSIFENEMWQEYTKRCTGCGRCTVSCPTCTCFTVQDIFYDDNQKNGERKRVWASCQIDGFTDMAGGHSYRQKQGDRTRFKVMHKIHDFKKRFGFFMCVGCGRCEDVCEEYISLRNAIEKINQIYGEGGKKNA